MSATRPAIWPRLLFAALLVAAGNGPAAAQGAPKAKSTQTTTGFPNALQGFQRNRTDPVKIEANALEVRDKDKTAVFSGNVVVQQGDTQMRCKELIVHYEGGALPTQPASTQAVAPQQLRRLVANGGVIVTTKDQRATGNIGIYDARTNTMTLSGNVVLLQGPNLMRGDRLVVLKPGQRVGVTGKPPYDLVIGNSSAVAATFRGAAVDVRARAVNGVARFSLGEFR